MTTTPETEPDDEPEQVAVSLPLSGTMVVVFDLDDPALSDDQLVDRALDLVGEHCDWDTLTAPADAPVSIEVETLDAIKVVHQGGGVWCAEGIAEAFVERGV